MCDVMSCVVLCVFADVFVEDDTIAQFAVSMTPFIKQLGFGGIIGSATHKHTNKRAQGSYRSSRHGMG